MKTIKPTTQAENLKTPIMLIMIGVSIILFLTSCSTKAEPECEKAVPCIPPVQSPYEHLSEYGLFRGELKNLDPIDGLLPYDLNTELFSDYAQKQRFIYVPEEESIAFTNSHVLEFPPGTVLVKNFYYNHDDRSVSTGRTLIETRLLIRYVEGWKPNTYVWNSDQTGARLIRTGEVKPQSWTDSDGDLRNVDYVIPSVNDCGSCHRKNGEITPLGPNVRNLNKEYDYPTGEEHQLQRWRFEGYFGEDFSTDTLSQLPVWNNQSTASLNLRARAYLDVNCSSCHNEAGSARNSGLFLDYDQDDSYRLGVCKIPVAAGSGMAGLKYDIVPGKPDESILLHRMGSTQPGIRMPEIGRTLVHEEAIRLISEWIESMDIPTCE
jgi:uncharacterized repeat protein (TIGR03806 family)